ncbi:MAG: transposase [Betaproteobacteria bacterium]
MPRQPRFWFPGAVLHVVQRGNNCAAVFLGDEDRRYFLKCLVGSSRMHDVAVHAYVLMTNHVHLLVSPRTPMGPRPRDPR